MLPPPMKAIFRDMLRSVGVNDDRPDYGGFAALGKGGRHGPPGGSQPHRETPDRLRAPDRPPSAVEEERFAPGADHRGGSRDPNTAVPTRTMVAPSATAASRSPVIPMDKVSSG